MPHNPVSMSEEELTRAFTDVDTCNRMIRNIERYVTYESPHTIEVPEEAFLNLAVYWIDYYAKTGQADKKRRLHELVERGPSAVSAALDPKSRYTESIPIPRPVGSSTRPQGIAGSEGATQPRLSPLGQSTLHAKSAPRPGAPPQQSVGRHSSRAQQQKSSTTGRTSRSPPATPSAPQRSKSQGPRVKTKSGVKATDVSPPYTVGFDTASSDGKSPKRPSRGPSVALSQLAQQAQRGPGARKSSSGSLNKPLISFSSSHTDELDRPLIDLNVYGEPARKPKGNPFASSEGSALDITQHLADQYPTLRSPCAQSPEGSSQD
jgi:hypothetical protein